MPSLVIHYHGLTTTASPLARGAKQPTQNEEEEGKTGRGDQGQDRVWGWDLPMLGAVIKFIH
jgi:hypothetical protein